MLHIPHRRNRAHTFSRFSLRRGRAVTSVFVSLILLLGLVAPVDTSVTTVHAQDTVTGAFEGMVTNSVTGAVIAGASVEIINQQTGQSIPKTSDTRGRFYQGLLSPGVYTIRVSATGFATREVRQRLFITRTGEVVPVPVALDPAPAVAPAAPTPTPLPQTEVDTDIRARINASDARQGGAFTEEEVSTLPLGSSTFTRTFDELTFLLPGVAPPPQTLGSVAGPGIGAGVGSAGQFSVNGLRSRANNFTVDGSDNNDEDIGVRRQGFFSLVPQPIESIREYQAITLLAPAQFGRNIGAQVNAVSKSGGSSLHGTLYGFLNTSQLNARNPFDSTGGNNAFALSAGNNQPVLLDNQPLAVRNGSGGEDSFTLGQGGFALGGPLKRDRIFYFVSAEGTRANSTREESFAVPTVEQRGFGGTGATGLPLGLLDPNEPFRAFPTSVDGDAIFSLFPFPNNPSGIYGANTFTQTLPSGGRGVIASAKVEGNFKLRGREQNITERYNFTEDSRFIPVSGGAIFSTLKPRVRTQNNSFYLNSELSGANSTRPLFNQLRLSYGRTRLNFAEERDQTYQLPNTLLPGTPFLLNAPLLENFTFPRIVSDTQFGANTGDVIYVTTPGVTVQNATQLGPTGQVRRLGAIGQVSIAGFSPLGVDVFNFPQRRVNNTYQVADELTMRANGHSFVFGTDIRRSELNSELPRNSRPLVTFAGAPELAFNDEAETFAFTGRFIRPETLAAASAPSGFFQTLALEGESAIGLRFYQLNFYAQDTWRVRPALSLSYGLRYEYNTPPREVNRRIESTFNDPALDLVPGLKTFIGNRTSIFEPDRNNFAPRLSVAYAPNLFGRERGLTVIRAGYGLFYDQILGAVVSQSRNVYPSYLTVNFAGGLNNLSFIEGSRPGSNSCPQNLFTRCPFSFINPSNPLPNLTTGQGGTRIVQPGTLNNLNPALTLSQSINLINSIVRGGGEIPPVSGFGATLPAQQLDTPMAHHFNVTVDQQLGTNLTLGVSYVGTRGSKLLRFNTPNLGPNAYVVPIAFTFLQPSGGTTVPFAPDFFGLTLSPGVRLSPTADITGGRPVPTAGTIYRFETTAESRYHALQLQARGRFRRGLQFQASYTFASATDDVSDVFDLAGASSLPQNSLDLRAERGPANFDVRHRFAYNFIYDFSRAGEGRSRAMRFLLDGLQLAGTGQLQSGQPFTVNSVYDVNLDGNLTDRLNTVAGLERTGDRRQPLRLSADPTTLLAPIGEDGRVGRNTFRAGNLVELDLALIKNFKLGETQSIVLRMDAFNFINRANYGIPVRFLEAPAFGQSVNTVTPGRRIQFALKYNF
ncbi:MAG TPA: carboxypeptidase-like regulatory domain-containing protein [Pyrinomonadaceae bacterium]|nr:carboxypeptidase-like regulatory domain-containing protein [Pyrinomonadaceae bacterium]